MIVFDAVRAAIGDMLSVLDTALRLSESVIVEVDESRQRRRMGTMK